MRSARGRTHAMDESIQVAIGNLVDEERRLRDEGPDRPDNRVAHLQRLRDVEGELDQCWDLLRQRRARRAAGLDPATSATRPVNQVQRYLG